MPGFFMSWLSSELPTHHIALQGLVLAALLALGALEEWPGWLGAGMTGVSIAGLLGLRARAPSAEAILEAGLSEALGADYRSRILPEQAAQLDEALDPRRLWRPFHHRDPRVERLADLAYGPHGVRNHLDVYRPLDAARPLPVVLQVHGGGWVYGQKEHQALPLMYHLAARGWICVAMNYRLSPAATFPEHLVDVKRAIAWIRTEGAEHGAAPDFLAITGGSAGGHLAALAALTANDPEYQPGFEEIDTRVQACVPLYAPYDLVDRHGVQNDRAMERLIERQFIKRPLDEARDEWEKGSPLSRAHAEAPPFFVLHGTHDSLAYIAGARHFREALQKAGASELAYVELPQAQHAFDTFQSVRGQLTARAIHRYLAYQYSQHLQGTNASR